MKTDKIQFVASLLPIATAISVSGLGDGAVLKLDIPASEIYSIVRLQLLAGTVFKVTIEEIKDIKNARTGTEANET